jgi:putative Mg2+ transporter-C (MgtC) family protein
VAVNSALDELSRLAPDVPQLVRVTVRLLAALFIGTLIGLQRELTHKPAGLRTHMLVGLGTALFIVSAAESGMHLDALSRIVQGLATGIGFLGGGAILKLTTEREIHGLTTAAGIWMTAAAGAAAGLGQIAVALIGTLLGLLVLIVFHRIEKGLGHRAKKDMENHPPHGNPDPKDLA